MPVITLTTDWGIRDLYAAALKGALLSANENFNIVDITHQIDPFDLTKASFVFKNAFHFFPPKTIHLVAVSSQMDNESSWLIATYKTHKIVCKDDGFLSLVVSDAFDSVVRVDYSAGLTITKERELMVSIASGLTKDISPESFGPVTTDYKRSNLFAPVIDEAIIKGAVIYVDEFGNVISNISHNVFEDARKGRLFEIDARKQQYIINSLNNRYEDSDRGELLALFNSSGLLEISVRHGDAAGLLGLKFGDTVRVMFK